MYLFTYIKREVIVTNALKGGLSLKIFRSKGSRAGGHLRLNIMDKFVNN